ncbi:hypothetical protein [Thermoleophilum album]|uniref:Uncharacterized protein n=1 Tax=Thermoleophilum album TaxID=29539 RepID=A0A1H6G1K6_THEAL|nr:hypothetical protein [Thermoleophilum album]SEH16153.1 hypothetical protein SAMN02745716_2097 [Thermoleophilum album]
MPLLVFAAVAFDSASRRNWSASAVAAALAVALYVTYVPYLNWIRSDVRLETADVVLGLPLAWLGGAAAIAVASGKVSLRLPGRRVAATSVVLLVAAMPAAALAHDPGQGEETSNARVTATAAGPRAQLHVDVAESPRGCGDLEPRRAVARRAGEVTSGPLRRTARCTYRGSVALPARGRWFVYAEFRRGRDRLETWVPVIAGTASPRTELRSLYVPPSVSSPLVKTLSGIAMYGVFLAIALRIGSLYRREAARRLAGSRAAGAA